MKSILICFFSLLLFSQAAFSQFSIAVEEGEMNMSQGTNNALYMNLTKVNQKDLEKAWTKYMKDFKGGKTKRNKKTKEIFSDNMALKKLSSNTIDVYAKSTSKGDDAIQLAVWFDMGGAYLNSKMHAEAYAEAEKMLQDFALSVSKAMVEEILDNEKKKLSKLQGDLKDLGKQKKGYEDDIAKCEKKIEEAKQKIEQNGKDQGAKESEIKAQEEVVKKVKDKLDKMD